jgi:hypothetical protein
MELTLVILGILEAELRSIPDQYQPGHKCETLFEKS